MGKSKKTWKTKAALQRPRGKFVSDAPKRKKLVSKRKKPASGKKRDRDRPREVELELLQIRVSDGELPDELHGLALEEFQKNRITLEELNELLALHSRPAVVSIPTMDDETYDAELKEMVNDDA